MSDRENKTDRTQGALRLMEALSGVDQKLLLRSECRRKPYWAYGSAAAACLALVVVGALSWNGLRMIWTSKGGADSSSTGGNSYDSVPMLADARSGDVDEPETAGGYAIPEEHDKFTNSTDGQPENNPMFSGSREEEVFADPRDPRKELSEEEARNTEVFGAYLPENLPRGYTFESGRGSDSGITVTWTRGMDYIMISVSLVESESTVTVDVEKPETYDVWLYEIPYGETVPEEYRQVFDDPLFAVEDLSLEVVRSRMKSVRDAGDTDTPRGSFSVLYPDGVVLHFNGRGSADEIWEMLHS